MSARRVRFARWMVGTAVPCVFRRANPIVMRMARSRLHPLLRGSVLIVRCTGRRTGRTYLVPVLCRPSGEWALFVMTSAHARWWRNIESGAPATVCYAGREREACIDVVRGVDAPSEVERALRARGFVARALVPLPASESALLRVRLLPDS